MAIIYEPKLGKKVPSAAALPELLSGNETLLFDCFHIAIKDKAIRAVHVDDDGDEIVSANASWSGAM